MLWKGETLERDGEDVSGIRKWPGSEKLPPAISSHPAETDPYEGSRQPKIRLDHSTGLVW